MWKIKLAPVILKGHTKICKNTPWQKVDMVAIKRICTLENKQF